MNKKILGIKISTILHFAVCVLFAVVTWFMIKYLNHSYVPASEGTQASYLLDMLQC